MEHRIPPRCVLQAYDWPEPIVDIARYGQGHINDTYRVRCQSSHFILQGLSRAAFPRPELVMENMVRITEYLSRQIQEQGGDPERETLHVLKTRDGRDFCRDEEGKVWRLMPFVRDVVDAERITPELFGASGRAFGRFQYMLRDFPAHTLHETIPRFHDTENRYANFERAVLDDPMGRCLAIGQQIRFVQKRKADCSVVLDALRQGKLPLRVTHNDTKINNVLFDRKTGQEICVIDLDTTMPGLAINDFGDSIRFGANDCQEDEGDMSKVHFDMDLYEIYTREFLAGTQGSLTQEEIDYLPWGARLMTLECGIRFLTDYIEGDHYFHISYPEQNLNRARTQFQLVQDMERQFDRMHQIALSLSK